MIKKAHLAFLVHWGIDRIWSTRSPLHLLWSVGTGCCWLSMIVRVEMQDKRSYRCKLMIKLSLNIWSLLTHQKLSKSFHCCTMVPLLMWLWDVPCWHLGIFPAPHGWISLPFLQYYCQRRMWLIPQFVLVLQEEWNSLWQSTPTTMRMAWVCGWRGKRAGPSWGRAACWKRTEGKSAGCPTCTAPHRIPVSRCKWSYCLLWQIHWSQKQFDQPDLSYDIEWQLSGLPTHNCWLPQRYHDDPPAIPVPIPNLFDPPDYTADAEDEATDPDVHMDLGPMVYDNNSSRVGSEPHFTLSCTKHDANDMFCEYPSGFPSYDLESLTLLECLCDDPALVSPGTYDEAMLIPPIISNYFCPFHNSMTWCLINWFYNSSTQKFLADLNSLVKTMMLTDNFDSKHLEYFDAHCEIKHLDDSPPHDPSAMSPTVTRSA